MLNVGQFVLDMNNGIGTAVSLHNGFEAVVELDLVVEIVHFPLPDVIPVDMGLINLGQQKGIGFDHFNGTVHIAPEFHWHHLGHIVAESIHTLVQPVKGNIPVFCPGIWHLLILPIGMVNLVGFILIASRKDIKIFLSFRIHSEIDFYRFVPVIHIGLGTS